MWRGAIDSSRIISTDDTKRTVTLLSSALMSEKEFRFMHLQSHCVAEMRSPLANVAAGHRGGSGAIQPFIATDAPIIKTPRSTRIIFGKMGVYSA